MRLLRWAGIALGGLLLLVAITAFGARFADGPLAIFPGGELTSGEWVEASPGDADVLATTGEIEFQLVEPPRSRTTWVVVHQGAIYVPCGMPTVESLKRWPHEAMKDGRAVIRFDGKRQRRMAVRVHERELRAALIREATRKYPIPGGDAEDEDAVWFFRLDARSES